MRERLLIVDGDAMDLASLTDILESDAVSVVSAVSGADAMRILREDGLVASVLVDWRLPDMEGVELIRWMKSSDGFPDVEGVLHAPSYDEAAVRRGIDAGAYYYLTSECDVVLLQAIVRAAMQATSLRRRLAETVERVEDAFFLLEQARFRLKHIPEAELLAAHIASACGTPDAAVGLRELLVNAVEHGNLGITFEEKSDLIQEGRLVAERKRRLQDDELGARRVQVALDRKHDCMHVVIRDEGAGFDFDRFMRMDEDRLLAPNGRGIMVACHALEIEYIPPGNTVRVELPIVRDP